MPLPGARKCPPCRLPLGLGCNPKLRQGNRICESEEVTLRRRPFFLQKRPDFSFFLMLIWQDMAKGSWPRFLGWDGSTYGSARPRAARGNWPRSRAIVATAVSQWGLSWAVSHPDHPTLSGF
jgi:hypothetical protein